MKKITYLAASILFAASCSETKQPEKVKTSQEKVGKSFGPEKVRMNELVSTAEMLAKFDPKLGDQEFHFEGKIADVCSKAGCWVSVEDGKGGTFRIMFKDHFTIPTDTKVGTIAYFSGLAYQDTVSVEDQVHLKGEGKTPLSKEELAKITLPSYEFGFEADGVTLK